MMVARRSALSIAGAAFERKGKERGKELKALHMLSAVMFFSSIIIAVR